MDKERVIKNMRDAIEANKHIREQTNNALSQAIGLLEKHDGEYERGANDAWELAKRIGGHPVDGGYDCDELYLRFESYTTSDVFNDYTFQEALAKLKAYEKKKEEEAAKPKLGNVVHIFGLNGTFITDGVLVGITFDKYYILRKSRGMVPEAWDIESYEFEKTGEYVDIQGMLDKIG